MKWFVFVLLVFLPYQIGAHHIAQGDLDGDGDIDFADYLTFVRNFERKYENQTRIPHESSQKDTVTIYQTVTVRDTIKLGALPPSITLIPGAGIYPTPQLYFLVEGVRNLFCDYLEYPRDSNIIVEFSQNQGPLIYHERASGGEYRIMLHKPGIYYDGGLSATGVVLQFAHEYGHLMANYRGEGLRTQLWFEESIANLASIVAMQAFSKKFTQEYLKNPSPEKEALLQQLQPLRVEANFMIRRGQKNLNGKSLMAWYLENKYHLETESVKSQASRDRQEIVSVALLDIFTQHTEAWNAVRYMNRGPLSKNENFKNYLTEWYKRTPPQWQFIVREIMNRFDMSP